MIHRYAVVLPGILLLLGISAGAADPVFASDFETNPLKTDWRAQPRSRQRLKGRWETRKSAHGTRSFILQGGALESAKTFKLTPHALYRVQFSAKAERSGKRGHWFVYFYDKAGRKISSDQYSGFAAGLDWGEFEFYFMARAGTVTARFGLAYVNQVDKPEMNDVRLFVDHVRLTPATPAAALAWMDNVERQLPPIRFTPDPTRHEQLQKTMRRLRTGGNLRIVMLGDGICNDMSNSLFHLLLGRRYPQAGITLIHSQRDGAGCPIYQRPALFNRYVADHRPDLLVIAGTSHNYNVVAVRRVIQMARKKFPEVEVLVFTGAITEPGMSNAVRRRGLRDVPAKQRQEAEKAIAEFYRKLAMMRTKEKFELMHLRPLWESYVRVSGKSRHWFMRDPVHANHYGKQALGRILAKYFEPVK